MATGSRGLVLRGSGRGGSVAWGRSTDERFRSGTGGAGDRAARGAAPGGKLRGGGCSPVPRRGGVGAPLQPDVPGHRRPALLGRGAALVGKVARHEARR